MGPPSGGKSGVEASVRHWRNAASVSGGNSALMSDSAVYFYPGLLRGAAVGIERRSRFFR
jgi:hypothetical protein